MTSTSRRNVWNSKVIESFIPDNHTIARAAAIWRPLAESQEALAEKGRTFLQEQFA